MDKHLRACLRNYIAMPSSAGLLVGVNATTEDLGILVHRERWQLRTGEVTSQLAPHPFSTPWSLFVQGRSRLSRLPSAGYSWLSSWTALSWWFLGLALTTMRWLTLASSVIYPDIFNFCLPLDALRADEEIKPNLSIAKKPEIVHSTLVGGKVRRKLGFGLC